MVLKPNYALLALSIFAISSVVSARGQWLERDGRAVYLYPRRFGQEQPAVLQKIRDACPGAVCGTLAGQAVTPLLAAQPECSQQDLADQIIDASQQFDAATAAAMVAAAVEYRQVEKNTPPDFTQNPPALRNSVFCQKAPRNHELNGLVQAQDPANDPNLFFDPALGKTVLKGSQANTFPFGQSGSVVQSKDVTITVTVSGTVSTPTDAVTVQAGNGAATTAAAPAATSTSVNGADFGSCSTPQIEFGVGFDGRKETSFQPADKTSFNHGSADNIDIITKFICDTLTNSCKANQAAKDLCAQAESAADAATVKTGAQADAFNAVFGIQTDFASVTVIDDQGNVVSASTGSNAAPANAAPATTSVTSEAAAATATAASVAADSSVGNFGKCSVPQIKFGVGFDNRKETSFEPADQTSFNHGSADNIDIITQFICDTLTNSCGADATAKATCAKAEAAADTATKGTGAQADAFNAVFGIKTDFAAVQEIDNQGRPVVAAPTGSNAAAANAPSVNNAATKTTNDGNAGSAPSNATSSSASSDSTSSSVANTLATANLQTFTGALGGVTAPPVTATSDGKFQVTGNSAFNDQKSAIQRSCDVQNNQCANAANSSGNKNGFTVASCNAQQSQCNAAAA
ncbi:hypothetical protein CPB84DRAFT_1835568 [Gymnopilus junonius]|uniref:Uncharacterized protein n=1 Tax=Gymnopilus junonius TaxID=109634 RepID=A0A9P5NV85_GYMJU|nr:hypothetical protein CPB84DRAFT_1835568 [Gymnopilus junonius]